ncbi:low-density lipoprotein receptor-like isoform X2 [Pomacea canaliculata]|uniref:low-density lipoprotein receptor-like isoform X2 n=1 Tax=Pomacea canaliculata TaxID=400727 RepID=UPI000D72AAAE|nr:low-density lipoprotein receptor-like isoform X2 [Pomacea canaliculata]
MLRFAILLFLVVTVTEADINYKNKVKRDLNPGTMRKRQVTTCGENQFMCKSGECILAEWTCDTQADCQDGSDEQECECVCRGEHKFQCQNGKCVPSSFICDSDNDCGDMSDETDCHLVTCRPGMHRCDEFRCINEWDICDGVDDCRDGWDESNCDTCNDGYIHCANSTKCIPDDWRCDGWANCPDGSDEQNCVCNTTTHFLCTSGQCIRGDYRCDGNNDCSDGSDEVGCPPPHPSVCSDHLSVRGCLQMNDTSTPICLDDDLGFKYCRKFCNLCLSDE